MSIKANVKRIYHSICDVKRKNEAVREAKQMANVASYFPELKQKTKEIKTKENVEWARKYGEVNKFYTLYGLDIVGLRNPDDYIDYYSFMVTRNQVNRIGGAWNYLALLRDKYLFYKYMNSNCMPVPEVFAIIRDNQLYDESMRKIPWESLSDEKEYFVKDIDGECASFVKHIKDYHGFSQIKDRIKTGSYILQRKVVQHEGMSLINPKSINTLRIVTINKDGDPYVLSALLRVGTNKTGNVDNWAAGGLAIGIEENGYLKKYGFYKPIHGTKESVHPDTGVIFSEFKIPMYKEALRMACDAHRCFYGVRAIGWDVAISETGPIFIEGNDNFEISLQQACDRPLKRDWVKACQ